ncbi:MAG: TIM barrel protein [Gemmatimonadota bacterium]|jgi:hydroxypyruvate isomerase|nr:TIM barrel protein [Gemmatimonadota bacterium]MDQ8148127.1 TIM barrel protein [Gemmatimonadota bacterium]MDQ8149269.1 TIM barrel protein [Gemmatimonadota bacterium]MDQ8155978.1 TIM barrel protein [Gemmatimonadota bacterium]
MSPSRRDVLRAGLGATAGAALGALPRVAEAAPTTATPTRPDAAPQTALAPVAPAYRQSVARWCFSSTPIDDLCREAKRIGLHAIDLLSEDEWAVPARHGLACAIANGPGPISDGWNTIANHDRLVAESERLLPKIAAAGIPQMIVFSGNRRGLSDGEGIANCVRGLRRILPLAERLGVTITMELLNSKVDHRDYQADRTPFGVAIAEALGSSRFKLLYDIYHMQIMEGDVVRTIETYHRHIGHYHTAGVPGRHELDATQELYYPRIAQAIVGTGFTGFVAHEFMPTTAGFATLQDAQRIFAGA